MRYNRECLNWGPLQTGISNQDMVAGIANSNSVPIQGADQITWFFNVTNTGGGITNVYFIPQISNDNGTTWYAFGGYNTYAAGVCTSTPYSVSIDVSVMLDTTWNIQVNGTHMRLNTFVGTAAAPGDICSASVMVSYL